MGWIQIAWLMLGLSAGMAVTTARCEDSPGSSTTTVAGIVFDIRSDYGDGAYWESRAADLIGLRLGGPFSPDQLAADIETLRASNLFEEITAPDPETTAEGVRIRFQLTPFRRIKDIRLINAFPMFEREILNAMTIYTGDVFVAEKLSAQADLLMQLYKREGYIDPKVDVSAAEDPRDGDYVVTVRVRKGPYFVLRDVAVTGNRTFSDFRLKLRLSTWKTSQLFDEMQRFNKKDVDADGKNLLAFYREKQFADIAVTPVIQEQPCSCDKMIRFEIHEGPRYHIEFQGNRRFWDWTLKKDLVLFRQGNRGELGLKKSVRKIQERYHQAGYLQARINPVSVMADEDGMPLRTIRLNIEEGPPSVVEEIRIQGNDSFDDGKIEKQMLTRPPGLIHDGRFVPEILDADVRAILSLYLKAGYREVAVQKNIDWRDDPSTQIRHAVVRIDIVEGIRTMVNAIDIAGVSTAERAELIQLLALKSGEPFREYMVQSDENTLAAGISEKGYPHVTAGSTVDFSADGAVASVLFSVEKGPYAEMGRIYPVGNFRTRERIIRDEIEQRPGEPFSFTKMLASQRNVQDIGAFDKARLRPLGLQEKSKEIDLMVEVEEKKPYFFQMGTGYNTQKEFYVNSRIGDHNLLGSNKDAFVGGELSMIGYRLEAGLVEPRFLWSRIQATLNLYGEEKRELNKNYGTRTQGASLLFNRKLLETITASFGLRYELRDQFQRTAEPIPADELELFEPRSILVASPAVTYDSSDSFIRPRKGLIATLSLDVSRGLLNSLDDFNKYGFRLQYYYTPVKKLTIALRGRTGYIEPHNARSVIPDDQLFYLGGLSDVRGFDENKLRYDVSGQAVGGRSEMLGSVEARWDLGLNFELSVFYDTGRIQSALSAEGDDGWRSSAGMGLAYITPIGPIGLMYGHKLNKRPDESPGRFHFSIGYTF